MCADEDSISGLRLFAEQLLGSGFSPGHIRQMMCINPTYCLIRSRTIVKVFKGGLIGCGFFSQHHREAWQRMPNVRIIAACDRYIERAEGVAEKVYSSAEAMLDAEELDFIDIVSRSTTHLELISLAAKKGVAIVCQKPLAPDWKSACRVVEIAALNRVRLMIHDNWRWQPWYRAAHNLIRKGYIGTPIAYAFRCRWSSGAGDEPYRKQEYFRDLQRLIIDETLVHHIDTARFLFGDISSIYAETRKLNPIIRGDDQAILTARHDDNMLGTIDGHSFLDQKDSGPTAMDDAVFEGESGAIRVSPRGEIWSGYEKIWTDDFSKGYRGDSVYAALAHFISCLESGERFESEAREYLEKTFSVVEAAYMSAASNRRIRIADILAPRCHEPC
jgi:predicted dehydrogenase